MKVYNVLIFFVFMMVLSTKMGTFYMFEGYNLGYYCFVHVHARAHAHTQCGSVSISNLKVESDDLV